MPLTPRSLGGLLLPALLSLSPLAANAASEVTILRDQWGIPQVYADDIYGLFAGFGYAVAEDRLFQMEMAAPLGARHRVRGARAPSTWTTTPRPAPTSTRRRSAPRSRRCRPRSATSCAATPPGWNKRLAEVMADKGALLPKEFTDFGFEPTAWTDFDVAMIYVGTMAGRFSHFSNELNNAKAARRPRRPARRGRGHGSSSTRCFWIEDPLAPTTVPAGEQYQQKAEAPAPVDATRFAGLADLPLAGRRRRPPARQQPLDPRAGEDHRRQHHPRQRPAVRQLQPGLCLLHRPARRGLRPHRQHPLRGPDRALRHQRRHRLGRDRRAARRQRLRRARAQPGEPAPVPPGRRLGRHAPPPGDDQGQGRRRRRRRRLGDRLRRRPGLRRRARPRLRLPPRLGRATRSRP